MGAKPLSSVPGLTAPGVDDLFCDVRVASLFSMAVTW